MIRKNSSCDSLSTWFRRQVVVLCQNASLRTCAGVLLPFFVFACHAQAQSSENAFKVAATVDRTEVQIADPFQLTIQVTSPQDARVSFPELPQTVGAFEILERSDRLGIPDQKNPAVRTWTKSLTLETLETGQLKIPSIEITASQPGASSQVLRTTPIDIVVASVVEGSADLTNFQDIAGLRDVQPPDASSSAWVWWLLGTGAVLALVAGSAALFAKRREKPGEVASWAIRELDALADEDFLQSEAILRTFIAERFEFAAESYSANSITETLQKRGVAEGCLAAISEFFGKTEGIKFGGVPSQPADAVALVANARDLVQKLNQTQGD